MKRIILFSLLLLFSTFSFGQEKLKKEIDVSNKKKYHKIIALLQENKPKKAFKLSNKLKGTKADITKELDYIQHNWTNINEREKSFFQFLIKFGAKPHSKSTVEQYKNDKNYQQLLFQLYKWTDRNDLLTMLKNDMTKADSIDYTIFYEIIINREVEQKKNLQINLHIIQTLIDKYPNEFTLFEIRGLLYKELKYYKNANRDLTKCYEAKKIKPENVLVLVELRLKSKNYNQLEEIVESIPENQRGIDYYLLAADLYFLLGKYDLANKALLEADEYQRSLDQIKNIACPLSSYLFLHNKFFSEENNIGLSFWLPDSNYTEIKWFDPDIIDFPSKSFETYDNSYELTVKAYSDKPIKATDFQVFINNKPYDIGSKLGNEKLKINKHIYHFTKNIVLQEGQNKIKVKVKNEVGEATTEEFKFEYKALKSKPILHVFAIGTKPKDLNYTAKDAQDIASVFERNSQNLYDMFSGVKIRSLIGEKATSQNIATTLERLAINFEQKIYDSNEDISPNDVVVLFVSSHGFIGSNNEFRIQGQDFDVNTPTRTSVAYEELQGYLERIKCKKIVLIDACKSGGAKGDNSLSEVLARLNSKQKGTTIISSCQAHELSFEHQAWENGAFTEAIIEAFQGKCDSNNNKLISVAELFTYVEKRVMELVHSVNKPTQRPSINRNEIGNDVEFFKIK